MQYQHSSRFLFIAQVRARLALVERQFVQAVKGLPQKSTFQTMNVLHHAQIISMEIHSMFVSNAQANV